MGMVGPPLSPHLSPAPLMPAMLHPPSPIYNQPTLSGGTNARSGYFPYHMDAFKDSYHDISAMDGKPKHLMINEESVENK
jgi:hypothetical protein